IKEFLSDLEEVKQKVANSVVSGIEPVQSQIHAQPSIRHSSALQSISQSLRRPRLSIAWLIIVALFIGVIAWILFQRFRNRSSPQLENLEVVKLTNSGNVTDAAISPDGKYVVFVADELGKQSLWMRYVPTASNVPLVGP